MIPDMRTCKHEMFEMSAIGYLQCPSCGFIAAKIDPEKFEENSLPSHLFIRKLARELAEAETTIRRLRELLKRKGCVDDTAPCAICPHPAVVQRNTSTNDNAHH